MNKSFNKEKFFKVNPSYLVGGYIIVEVSTYTNKLGKEAKYYNKVLLMNQEKALELVVDTRNYYVRRIDGEKVQVSKEEREGRKKARDKAYNHSYYMKVTKEKRRKARKSKESRVKEAICKICGKPFTFISKPVQGGANRKICSACKVLLNKKHYYTRKCKHCGEVFRTTHKGKLYCSKQCTFAHNSLKYYHKKIKEKAHV